VKDQVFSGRDVDEAVAAASAALGVPEGTLRYLVLDPGKPAALGVGATPARIAVLLDRPLPGSPPAPAGAPSRSDPAAGARGILRAVAEAAHLEVSTEVIEDEGAMRVVVSGPGRDFFLADDAAALKAVEHLLQRMYGRRVASRRVLLDCEGYRESRDEALRVRARSLAAAVRGDGLPRETVPLNAYERRVVHLALADEPGVRTYSVGEGADRRVTVAPDGEGRG
jgi:spoIIIJ-associated protein